MNSRLLLALMLLATAVARPGPAAAQSAPPAGQDSVQVVAATDTTLKVTEEARAKAKPFEDSVRADSLNPQKRFELGNVYYDQGRLNEALAQFNKVVALDTTFWKAWVNIGTVQDELNRAPEAQKAFLKAIAMNPRDTFAYVKIANSIYAGGDVADAMEYYRKALTIDAHCQEARFMMGNAFAEQEMYREAVLQWKKVIAVDPASAEAKLAKDNVETVYTFFAEEPGLLKELKAITANGKPPAAPGGKPGAPAKRTPAAATTRGKPVRKS